MTLPSPNPALPDQPNPFFLDNSFVRGDQQRANNGFIWNNLEDLDDRITVVEDASIKIAVDYSKPMGEIFFLPDEKATNFTYDPLNPRDYFPAICLSAIEGVVVYDDTDLPEAFIDFMRGIKIKYLPGVSGEVSSWSVTVAGAVVTFPNTASANAVLAALVEDVSEGTSNSIGRYLQISNVIYTVVEGGVNLVARTVEMSVSPPSGSQTAEWYAHKSSSSVNEITIRSMDGRALMSPNDTNGYFIAGLRTRGYMQGHLHYNGLGMQNNSPFVYGQNTTEVPGIATGTVSAAGGTPDRQAITSTPKDDGTNGTPLTRKITHGPALTQIPYMWVGGE